MKKLEASSNITGIESRSLSSVTPKRHFAQATQSLRDRLSSGQWELLWTVHVHHRFLLQPFQALPGAVFPKSATLPSTYLPPTAGLCTQYLLRQLSAAVSASPLSSCFPYVQMVWSNSNGYSPKHKIAFLRGFLSSNGKTLKYRRRNKALTGQPRNRQFPLVLIPHLVEYLFKKTKTNQNHKTKQQLKSCSTKANQPW